MHWHCDTKEVKLMDIQFFGSIFSLWIFNITINAVM